MQFSHMCRMDHDVIGHNDCGDDKRCPLCRAYDETTQLRSDLEWTTRNLESVQASKDAALASRAALELEIVGLKKSNHLLMKGTESITELYDGMKHELRSMKSDLAEAVKALEPFADLYREHVYRPWTTEAARLVEKRRGNANAH